MVVIQLNYITGLVLRKPFEVFCLFVCFFKLRVSQKCCIFPMIYTFYLLHRILYILIWPHPQSKENNLSWLGSWLSHHAPSTQSQTGNCLLTINTQWPFSFQAACLFDSSFLHLGDCSMVKWEAQKWDELDGGTRVKNPPANTGDERVVGLIPGLERIPWSKKWQTMPVFLPRKFHRQRSLASYSSWGHRESCLTEPEHTCR